MSKNIFLFNQIGKQNDFEVNNLTVNQDLKLTGAETDCLLSTDANSNVVTFNNGPARYLLEIDTLTSKPKWTNSILVDDITTNTMTINNTFAGDLLTFVDSSGSVERLARGPNNFVLCSDDSTFGLNYKSIYQLLNLQSGNVFADNIGFIYTEKPYYSVQPLTSAFGTTISVKNDFVNVIAGRKYKITYNFINSQTSGQNLFSIDISTFGIVKSFVTVSTQSCETIIHVFNAPTTTNLFIVLNATHNPTSGSGFVNNITFIVEPLGI